jgi:molecular chaperone DnaJ
MDTNKNYYNILGVNKDSDKETIRKAYKKLALKFHPDKHNQDKHFEDKFKEINEAYQTIGDDKKREEYDIRSPHGNSYNPNSFGNFSPFGGGNGNFNNDIFEVFKNFGQTQGFGFNFQNQFNEKLDINITVDVTLEDVYKNQPIKVSFNRNVHCSDCDGTGFDPNSESFLCDMCGGTGRGMYGNKCEQCQGRGRIYSDTCQKCNGEKVQNKKEEFQFLNSYQVRNSFRTRKSGYGHQSKFYRKTIGDLISTINFINNTKFKIRLDNNLEYVLNLHFDDAINGINYKIETPDNKSYEVKIPPKTKDGDVLKLSGIGMLNLDGKTRSGIYIVINIIIDYERIEKVNL